MTRFLSILAPQHLPISSNLPPPPPTPSGYV
jgi:hypothetical protein